MQSQDPTTLYIDTSGILSSQLILSVAGNRIQKTIIGPKGAQKILSALDAMLQDQGLAVADIHAIVFHTGPGSYTGLRVGATVACMLGLLLCVNVNNHSPQLPIVLTYAHDS